MTTLSTKITYSHPMLSAKTASRLEVALDVKSALDDARRRPLNLALVIDRSGSMGGSPLHYAIQAAQMVVDHMTPEDHVSVVTYDDTVRTLIQPTLVKDPKSIKSTLAGVRAGGLTNLSGGWATGRDLLEQNAGAGAISRILLLTDGQANVGTTNPTQLIAGAAKAAKSKIVTTTLGFGTYFNEDLLIGMADAAGGNFYFIQSPDAATEVFKIEVEGLATLVAEDLVVELKPAPGIKIAELLNDYPTTREGDVVTVQAGDVYGIEPRPLNFTLETEGLESSMETPLFSAELRYKVASDKGKLKGETTTAAATIPVVFSEEVIEPDVEVLQTTARLRIGRLKEEATKLADSGKTKEAGELLRDAIKGYRDQKLDQSFEFAEELELLEHYATQLTSGHYGAATRKEIKDQTYQARRRGRADLQQRGLSAGSTANLDAVTAAEGEETGVVLTCVREKGKLRIRVVSEGYDPSFNVQFPRAIRQEGARYMAEGVETAGNGSFYRATGDIKLLLRPGESRPASGGYGSSYSARRSGTLRKSTATKLADLERTTDIGDGVLVQIVKDKSKLRARVVSDGYDPNLNMRFPRQVREEGRLFVVDEVRPSKDGSYYMTYGQIKLLVQPGQTN